MAHTPSAKLLPLCMKPSKSLIFDRPLIGSYISPIESPNILISLLSDIFWVISTILKSVLTNDSDIVAFVDE